MVYTGSKVEWTHRYGNYAASVRGFRLGVVYDAGKYIVIVDGRKLVTRFAAVDDAKAAAIRLAVKLFSEALQELE